MTPETIPCPITGCEVFGHHYHSVLTGNVFRECDGDCGALDEFTACYTTSEKSNEIDPKDIEIDPMDIQPGDVVDVTRRLTVERTSATGIIDVNGYAIRLDDLNSTVHLVSRADKDSAVVKKVSDALHYGTIMTRALIHDLRGAGIELVEVKP